MTIDSKTYYTKSLLEASSGTLRIYDGTGLGLAIEKQLVESQSGTIEVTSEVMVGSSFEFILGFEKVSKDCEHEDQEVLIAREEEEEISVLVVEGIALNQLLMKTLLDDFGFDCVIAAKGRLTIEKLMDRKIESIVKKKTRLSPKNSDLTQHEIIEEKEKYTNLSYLLERTKSNPILMSEMISLYLEQTPPLILAMKDSLRKKDWISLHAAVHKMIPSFSIVGIAQNYESLARKVQDSIMNQELTEDIVYLVNELENVCTVACLELTEELENLKKTI